MTHAIRVLTREHERLAALLRVMDDLLDEFDEGALPDFRLLGYISQYLTGYPEKVHHPKEDLIYRRLRKRAAGNGAGDLVHEHEELSSLTRDFANAVTEGKKSPADWQVRLNGTMRSLVDSYRHHMAMVEKHFFPAAERELSESDWAEVTYAISEQVDPLFDAATRDFEFLRDRILATAQEYARRQSFAERVRAAADELAGLSSIDDFNALVSRSHSGVSLVAGADGTHRLERDGETVFEIPACDEKTAVWSAYGFVSGARAFTET